MITQIKGKTNWWQIFILIAITAVAVYYIKDALAKPFVDWQTYNQVRAAEIKAELNQ